MTVMLRDVNVVFDLGETSCPYTTSRIITSWLGTVVMHYLLSPSSYYKYTVKRIHRYMNMYKEIIVIVMYVRTSAKALKVNKSNH